MTGHNHKQDMGIPINCRSATAAERPRAAVGRPSAEGSRPHWEPAQHHCCQHQHNNRCTSCSVSSLQRSSSRCGRHQQGKTLLSAILFGSQWGGEACEWSAKTVQGRCLHRRRRRCKAVVRFRRGPSHSRGRRRGTIPGLQPHNAMSHCMLSSTYM